MLGDVGGEIEAVFQHREKGQRREFFKCLQGADKGDSQGVVEAFYGEAQEIVQTHATQNTNESGTADILVAHNDDGKERAESHHHGHDIAPILAQQIKGSQIHTGRGIGHDDTGILQRLCVSRFLQT